jgi:hypothetical protein
MTAKQKTDNYAPPPSEEASERLVHPPSLDYVNDVRGGPSGELFRDAVIVHTTAFVELLSVARRIAVTLDEINNALGSTLAGIAKTP